MDKLVQAARRRKAEKRQRQRVRRRRVIERRSAGVSRAAAVSNWKDAETEVEKATNRLREVNAATDKLESELHLTNEQGKRLVRTIEKLMMQRLILSVLCGLEAAGIIALLVLR